MTAVGANKIRKSAVRIENKFILLLLSNMKMGLWFSDGNQFSVMFRSGMFS
tara:strand:+ start:82130 stop:82282 length:153 start_codon:yes stop_codon:yes gene_type:complete